MPVSLKQQEKVEHTWTICWDFVADISKEAEPDVSEALPADLFGTWSLQLERTSCGILVCYLNYVNTRLGAIRPETARSTAKLEALVGETRRPVLYAEDDFDWSRAKISEPWPPYMRRWAPDIRRHH